MQKVLSLICFVALSGCASLTNQLGFKEVQETVSSRTNKQLYWRNGTDEDKLIEAKISRLLEQTVTADSATQIALLNNRGLQATYQTLGIAQADLVHAGLFSNPFFGGEIRFPSDGVNLELSVVQNFIGLLEIPLRKKIAESKFEEAKLQVIQEALSLSHQVRKAFYLYQAAEQLLEMSKTALLALEASKELAEKLHAAGNISDLALAQEQVNFETLKIEITTHEEEVISARERINVFLGLEEQQTHWIAAVRLADVVPLQLKDDEIEKQALANNLSLARARQNLLTLATQIGYAEKFRSFDEFELGISGEKEPGGGWSFGPAFGIPLPFFSQGQTEIFRANAELQRQHEISLELAINIRSRIRSLTQRLRIVELRLLYYQTTLLPLHSKLLAETQKHYNAMLLGAFQLLEAKHKQINMGKDYILSLRDYWLIRTELESALNGYVLDLSEMEVNIE